MHKDLIRSISTLKQQKYQYIYGINPVEVALHAQRRQLLDLLVTDSQAAKNSSRICKLMQHADKIGIKVSFKSKILMSNLVKQQPHQNVILKASELPFHKWKLHQKYSDGIYLYTDQITDPQNYGAILRSALYFGVVRIFSSIKNHCPLNPTVSKVSSGALQLMDITGVSNGQLFLQKWKFDGGTVMATTTKGNSIGVNKLHQICVRDNLTKVMVLLGSEGKGISPHLIKNADYNIQIIRKGLNSYPYELIDSLNVSSALATILFELTKS